VKKKAMKSISELLEKNCMDCKKANVEFIIKKIKERLLG
jgi:hypothetical protein